jgi:hypothetical protein
MTDNPVVSPQARDLGIHSGSYTDLRFNEKKHNKFRVAQIISSFSSKWTQLVTTFSQLSFFRVQCFVTGTKLYHSHPQQQAQCSYLGLVCPGEWLFG